MDPALGDRLGVTSRIRPAPGRGGEHPRRIDYGARSPCRLIVYYCSSTRRRERGRQIQATIGLVDGAPAIIRVDARAPGGLDPALMQRQFRWASPLEAANDDLVPILLGRGIDPFAYDLPVDGFPESAALGAKSNEPLTTSSSRPSPASTWRVVGAYAAATARSGTCRPAPSSAGSRRHAGAASSRGFPRAVWAAPSCRGRGGAPTEPPPTPAI